MAETPAPSRWMRRHLLGTAGLAGGPLLAGLPRPGSAQAMLKAIPVTVGYCLKETIEKSPGIQLDAVANLGGGPRISSADSL
jgi:hypothetical protein